MAFPRRTHAVVYFVCFAIECMGRLLRIEVRIHLGDRYDRSSVIKEVVHHCISGAPSTTPSECSNVLEKELILLVHTMRCRGVRSHRRQYRIDRPSSISPRNRSFPMRQILVPINAFALLCLPELVCRVRFRSVLEFRNLAEFELLSWFHGCDERFS